jgi:hypothetical protein
MSARHFLEDFRGSGIGQRLHLRRSARLSLAGAGREAVIKTLTIPEILLTLYSARNQTPKGKFYEWR